MPRQWNDGRRVFSYWAPALEELFKILPRIVTDASRDHRGRLTTEERPAELVRRGFAHRPDVQRSNRNEFNVFGTVAWCVTA